jgi:alginate O-acetyltransferase complex protein AlgI
MFDFIAGYTGVFFLMVLGYILHFVPDTTYHQAEVAVRKMPLVLKAVCIVAVIVIVIQTKSAEIQPFIYFQF